MGKLIVSWSPIHGQSATTSNVISLSALMALDEPYRSLITHTQMSYSILESVFMMKKDDALFSEGGMVALERLVKSNLLKPEVITDYTKMIYPSSLDLLQGRTKDNNSEESAKLRNVIMAAAAEHYDFLWIDAHSGNRSHTTNNLLEEADLIIINLPQNKYILDQFFLDGLPEQIKNKNHLILISNYDDKAALSIRNIKRNYKITAPIYPVPYSTGFRDAMNQESVAAFFYRTKSVGKRDKLYPFISSLRKVNQVILKELGHKRMEEVW